MPTYISDRGKWIPAKEKIGLTNKSDEIIEHNGEKIKPGEPFVYDGPDREAVKELALQQVEHLGTDFRSDPEFLQAVRNQNFNSVEDYLRHIGYNELNDQKRVKDKKVSVKAHEIAEKVKELKIMGGGKDYAGNKDNDVIGGFGDEKLRKPSEVSG